MISKSRSYWPALGSEIASAASHRRLALVAVIASAIVFSWNGWIVRRLEGAGPEQAAFFRALFLLITLSIFFVILSGRASPAKFVEGGWSIFAGALQGCGAILYLIALAHTTVASVMLTQSAGPLFAAALASLLFRDHLGRSGLVALPIIAAGVALMAIDSVRNGSALGMAAALGNTALFALFLVIIRRSPAPGLVPTLIVGALTATIFAALLAETLAVSWHDLALLALWGGVIQAVGLALVVFSSRSLHAAEISTLGTLEFALGPFWVWLDKGEAPSTLSGTAGVVVLITIVVWLGMKVRNVQQAIPLASVDAPPLSADTSLTPASPLAKKNENAAAGDDRGAAPRPHIGHLPEHDDA
jgi:drug/metabolite transporter (DMT)-like permease